MSEIVTVVLGDEWNSELWGVLKSTIFELGGVVTGKFRGFAGSQEVDSFEVKFNDSIVQVESETYIGLSITGEASLVEKIKSLTDNARKRS